MQPEVYYLSVKDDVPCNSYWDYTIVADAFKYLRYKTNEVRTLPEVDSAVVVVPARHHSEAVAKINVELKKIKKVVLFLMGDEERQFPVDKIKHSDIEIWVQNPHPDKDDIYHRIGTGYAPHDLSELPYGKTTDVFFSGQITHVRREFMQHYFEKYKQDNWRAYYTDSFTAGFSPEEYFERMARARIVPAPSGAVIPDSFRTYEALQTMAVPIADEVNPKGTINGYWEWLFGGVVPFARIKDWKDLKGYSEDILEDWNSKIVDQTTWWLKWKRDFALKIKEQVGDNTVDDITVMVPTSPIPSHPDTKILDETIASIRHHLPDAEIIIQIDGVRKEQEDKTDDYKKYITRVLWNCLHKWERVLPIVFDEHRHQTGMARETLDLVQTPLLFYCEQDTPLVLDYEIPFDMFSKTLKAGQSDLIRLHFEAGIPEPHKHLMLGVDKNNKELTRTIQWSQRPHLASKAYYKRILNDNFTAKTNSFIEDKMHSVVQSAYNADGLMGWNQHKLHIFTPIGNIKRSYHTDGRAGGKKYDKSQIF